MTDPLDIPQSGRHVWVFSYDGPSDALNALSAEELSEALGLWGAPDMSGVERFDISTLTNYGFSRYLSEASGFDLGEDSRELNALTGPVLLLYSSALNEQDSRLSPEPPFALVGRYGTPIELPPITGIETASADGVLPQGAPPTSQARMSGMVATIVLVFLAIFVAAFVWIGG